MHCLQYGARRAELAQNRRGGYYPPACKEFALFYSRAGPWPRRKTSPIRARLAKRVQWFRGDPESRKTFGEEERGRSGFRRFAKRNTDKAEFAATKRARYGA